MSTGSATKAFLLDPKHFRIFGCKADDSCLTATISSVSEMFARQVLNVDSSNNEQKEI